MHQGKLLSEYCLRDGGQWQKKSFPPPTTKWNPTVSEQPNTMIQDCGGNLMFNMYLSGSSSYEELTNNRLEFFTFCPVSVRLCRGAAFRAQRCSTFLIWKPGCSFVGNRKSFFLDAFPGFSERRTQRRRASSITLQLEPHTIRIEFNQNVFVEISFI